MKLRFRQKANAGLVTNHLGDNLLEIVPRFLCRHEGILAILVTDRDGVPLVKGKTIESQSSVNLNHNSSLNRVELKVAEHSFQEPMPNSP